MYWGVMPVGSRHILLQFYVCETIRYACVVWLHRANWHEVFITTAPDTNFLQRLSSGYRGNCYKSLVSVCTSRQNIGGTLCGFINIHSNRNISRIRTETLSSTYISVESVKKNIFHENIRRGALYFFQCGRKGYLACSNHPSDSPTNHFDYTLTKHKRREPCDIARYDAWYDGMLGSFRKD